MREKQHEREKITERPPAHLTTTDGMNAWHLQQRHKEKELRDRRREAEAILRNYRSNYYDNNSVSSSRGPSPKHYGAEHLNDPSEHTGSEVGVSPSSCYYPGSFAGIHPQSSASQSVGGGSAGSGLPTPTFEEKKDYRESQGSLISQSPSYNFNKSNTGQEQQQPQYTGFLSPPPPEGLSTTTVTPGTARGRKAHGLTISTDTNEIVSSSSSPQQRPETKWRDFISSRPGSKFPPEKGRYHLYCSYACPGSHRALIVRALKGLDDVISVTYLHPVWRITNPINPHDKHRGWVFGDAEHGEPFLNTIGKGGPFPPAYEGNEPDPSVVRAFSIREIYESVEDTSGKYTIPLLWDNKLKTIVNNESSDISYMFNSCFNDFSTNPDLDLYANDDVDEKAKLYEVSEWLSPLMIHGVYRCGFAKTQWAYDAAINDLCDAFDRADDTLEQQRFLTGDTLTDVDIRLFVTLIRFDEVYTVYFKANARLVMLTPSLLNFCREIYQLPGVAATCNMEQIKAHFFASHAEWNKYSVIPRGLGFMELLDMPHDRAECFMSATSPMNHTTSLAYHHTSHNEKNYDHEVENNERNTATSKEHWLITTKDNHQKRPDAPSPIMGANETHGMELHESPSATSSSSSSSLSQKQDPPPSRTMITLHPHELVVRSSNNDNVERTKGDDCGNDDNVDIYDNDTEEKKTMEEMES